MHNFPVNLRGFRQSLLLFLVLSGVYVQAQNSNPALVAAGAEVQQVPGEFGFVEGPVADSAGNLYFTDIENNRLHRLSISGELTTLREPSNNANGLTMNLNGDLLICEQAAQRIVSMDAAGNISVIADSFNGARLNSPNDVWVHPDGAIYFTDPRYDWPQGAISQDGEHVYRVAPDGTGITRIIDTLQKPNGILAVKTDGGYMLQTPLCARSSVLISPLTGRSQIGSYSPIRVPMA